MAEKVQYHDFVEVNYTGKLADGTVFDTTVEAVAHNAGLPHQHGGVKPAIVCVGEKQLLPSLDADLVDKEVGKEYTTILPPESAFLCMCKSPDAVVVFMSEVSSTNVIKFNPNMNRNEQIIEFTGMRFDAARRSRIPRAKQWKVRREVKNRLGISRNLRSVVGSILGA